MRSEVPCERLLRLGRPVDVLSTLAPLRHGRWDPTVRLDGSDVWRTTRTEHGPATVHYRPTGTGRDGEVRVQAWGPGAAVECERADQLLGAGDDPSGFAAHAHPVMAAAHRRFGAGSRVPRTGRVLEALVPSILEQRVTGREATRAWASLVRRFGEVAPGPDRELRVAPAAADWAKVPSWAWHRAGVDPGRARTIVAAAGRADALERLSDLPAADASAALTSLAGIGGWTAAEVAVRAWGDPDAVSFGDYHLAGFVVWNLTGRRGGTDEEMAEVLAPWNGHRGRAVRMLELHCPRPPSRGPRATITDHRRW